MRLTLTAATLLAAAPALAGPPNVSLSGDLVDLTTQATPVSEVLDRLAQATGMKVVYEGPHPRVPVTVSLRQATAAQAVFQVLEGLGLAYATRLDPTGTKVETLLMVSGSGRPGRPAPPRAAAALTPRFDERFPSPDESLDEPLAEEPASLEDVPFAPDDSAPPLPQPVVPNAFPDSPFTPGTFSVGPPPTSEPPQELPPGIIAPGEEAVPQQPVPVTPPPEER